MSMDYTDYSPVRVAVVGGGAAGMMAAVAAANMGAAVTLFERNDRLGKKLRITGKGRCNVTNDCDRDTFLSNVPTNPRFLYSALAAFSSEAMIASLPVRANDMAACTLGSIEPGAKWPSRMYCSASAQVMRSSAFCSGLP